MERMQEHVVMIVVVHQVVWRIVLVGIVDIMKVKSHAVM